MTTTIAVGGKGGVGKTTVAALLVQGLVRAGARPVLAVDADPNTCLDELLGVRASASVGSVREEARVLAGMGKLPPGISKQQLLELRIAESLVEADDFDLVAMGRSEGPGCYCYANNVLRQVITTLSDAYPWVVIDNEAGLENLSRRIVRRVDWLVLVSDPSARGLTTVARLHGLAREMEVEFDHLALVVNRVRGSAPPPRAVALASELGAELLIAMPDDDELAAVAEGGEPVSELPGNNPVIGALDTLVAALRPS
jgi:CO dehydrogenase maturation factor